MTNQQGVPHPPGSGVRPTDKDPQPSEGQEEKDLGEDEGENKDGDQGPKRSTHRVNKPPRVSM